MDTGRISGRYAKAVHALAVEKGEDSRLYEEMCMLTVSFDSFRDLKKVLENPTITGEDKIKLLTTAAGVSVSESYKSLLKLLVKNGRASYIRTVALMYEKYYRKRKGMVITELITPAPASEETKDKLRELITKERNIQVDFITRIDPTLVGGFVLKLEDYQLDASIKTQLSRLKKQLTEVNNVI